MSWCRQKGQYWVQTSKSALFFRSGKRWPTGLQVWPAYSDRQPVKEWMVCVNGVAYSERQPVKEWTVCVNGVAYSERQPVKGWMLCVNGVAYSERQPVKEWMVYVNGIVCSKRQPVKEWTACVNGVVYIKRHPVKEWTVYVKGVWVVELAELKLVNSEHCRFAVLMNSEHCRFAVEIFWDFWQMRGSVLETWYRVGFCCCSANYNSSLSSKFCSLRLFGWYILNQPNESRDTKILENISH